MDLLDSPAFQSIVAICLVILGWIGVQLSRLPKTEPRVEKPRASEMYFASIETPWWDVLDVPRGASQDEIKRAYFSKAKLVHPNADSGAKSDTAFIRLKQAYERARQKRDV